MQRDAELELDLEHAPAHERERERKRQRLACRLTAQRPSALVLPASSHAVATNLASSCARADATGEEWKPVDHESTYAVEKLVDDVAEELVEDAQSLATSGKSDAQRVANDIVDLQSDMLRTATESLQRCFAGREVQVSRLLAELGKVGRVEQELTAWQKEYQACSQRDLRLIQDALRRAAASLHQLNHAQHSNAQVAEDMDQFRRDCMQQIDALLGKLDKLNGVTTPTTVVVGPSGDVNDTNGSGNGCHGDGAFSAMAASKPTKNDDKDGDEDEDDDEMQRLRLEISACHSQLQGMAPQRMDTFATQLEHLQQRLTQIERHAVHENALSRQTLENVLAQQMTQFRLLQTAETKRLQDEMDELHSDMCDILKEMHLLKERTKYLGPDYRFRLPTAMPMAQSRGAASSIPSARDAWRPLPWTTSQQCTHCGNRHPEGSVRGQFCPYPQCPAGIPTAHRRALDGNDADNQDHAHDGSNNYSHTCGHGHSEDVVVPMSICSPRRPLAVPLATELASRSLHPTDLEVSHSCPSPHFSSRSSSVSGRISVTRGGENECVDPDELERRLLEQHRLFWISEGAGSSTLGPSSRAQISPETARNLLDAGMMATPTPLPPRTATTTPITDAISPLRELTTTKTRTETRTTRASNVGRSALYG